ncbi:MAG: hypothetical protein KGJ13_04045 [Patescibacteria group bacterium]|nr:hypothetical protein [Patescibacteria group bacterium]
MYRKGFAPLVIIFILAAAALAGGAVWYFYKNQQSAAFHLPQTTIQPGSLFPKPNLPSSTAVERMDTSGSSVSSTASWKTYTNETYGFQFKYPDSWRDVWEGTTTYGNTSGFGINLKSTTSATSSVYIEIFGANSNATSTAGFFSMIGLDISGTSKRQISASGAAGDYYENVPGESNYNEALFLHGGKYYGVQDWTDDATFESILSTFQFLPFAPAAGNASSSGDFSINNMSEITFSTGEAATPLILDASGRSTGIDSAGNIVQKIPNSSYGEDQICSIESGASCTGVTRSIDIQQAANGIYELILTGVKSGNYDFSIYNYSQDGSPQPLLEGRGRIQLGEQIHYELIFNSSPGVTSTLILVK